MTFAYVRVSSRDQNPNMQLDLFEAVGYDRLYMEKQSGVKHLVELEKCINDLREGDTLLVYDLDRLGRSALKIIETVRYLHREKKVKIHSLNDNIDPSTFGGELVVHILSLLAEKERNKIITRCQDGREAALKRGTKFGRPAGKPNKKNENTQKSCAILYNAGQSIDAIKKTLNISRDTVYRYLSKEGIVPMRRNPKREAQNKKREE